MLVKLLLQFIITIIKFNDDLGLVNTGYYVHVHLHWISGISYFLPGILLASLHKSEMHTL